jgi:hypothetical protein
MIKDEVLAGQLKLLDDVRYFLVLQWVIFNLLVKVTKNEEG